MHIRRILLPCLLVAVVGSCRSSRSTGTEDTNGSPASESTSSGSHAMSGEQSKEGMAGAGQTGSGQATDMKQAADLYQRSEDRRTFLAKKSIEHGDQLRDQADLKGALAEYAAALEVDPSNETARARLREIQALMGDSFAGAAEYFTDEVQKETVRRAQAQLEAAKQDDQGDQYRRVGDYDKALESYRKAETILRFHPLIGTDSLDEKVLSEKIKSTLAEAQDADRRSKLAAAEEARKAVEEKNQEAADYRAKRLRTLYAQANEAFQNERYSVSEALANEILLYDPGNETAAQMRDIAQEARHQKTREDTHKRYREQWQRTMEEIQYMGIPQREVVVYDDIPRWKEALARQPFEFSNTQNAATQDKEAILQRLKDKRVVASFGENGEGAPLDQVARFLQSVSGVNFIISPKVTDELDEEETSVLLELPERSIYTILQLITESKENLRWKIEDGVVKFVTADELVGGQELKMYEVRDLIRPVKDFPGREINVQPSNGIEPPEEDVEEREALVITEDSLINLIRDNIAPQSWDADPANSIRISNGTMVVYQTPEVQAMIQKLLDDLREATGIMVDIQSRFLKVEDNFLEDIGIDFRGLGQPGLGTSQFFDDFGNNSVQQTIGNEIGSDTSPGAFYDNGQDGDILARTENLFDSSLGDQNILQGTGGLAFQWTYLNDLQLELVLQAVSKSDRVELVTAPNVLVFNTARSNLSVMNQLAYLQDFDVEIAQAASIADPIIGVVQDGVVLDVRPVVSADRRFITLELRPTVAQLKRPIRTFTTSLGVSGNSVTIQLPEVEISKVRTSVPMPDGGTVLLGGFKVHEEQQLRSGVPILNKIPLVQFLFDRKGHYVSNRKLLVLLKAKIVILQEHEPTPAQMGSDKTLQPR